MFSTIQEADLPFYWAEPGPHPACSADQGSGWDSAPHIRLQQQESEGPRPSRPSGEGKGSGRFS